MVIDNLSVHRGAWVRELVEARGASVMLLPSYSPDFNPVEEAFSKIKHSLKKAKARTLEALFEATHRALATVSEENAHGCFRHSGYGLPRVQPIRKPL